ncbi:hypothetical protein KEM52_004082 [Ascosphaera acerosa]|nr:hypothetical protein KEM52_004082 [Ascosphaera acerosa]
MQQVNADADQAFVACLPLIEAAMVLTYAVLAANLRGEELYLKLGEYLTGHLDRVYQQSAAHKDEALLDFYIREWQQYTTAAKFINHLFQYLNRHWVKRENDEGKVAYDVYTLHLVRWRYDMFMKIHPRLMTAVLNLVEKQRNGETIEQTKIKAVADSYVALGLDKSDTSKTTLEVYQTFFSVPYIAATRSYYERESRQFLAENSVSEYMKKAEARLGEEEKRIILCLHPDITKPLMQAAEEVLIADHSELLRGEFQVFLDAERQEDLARMYKLLARVPHGLQPLRTMFQSHVTRAGVAATANLEASGNATDPKVYIDALLEVHTKYENLVQTAFANESEFVRSLDNACREYVNRNEISQQQLTRTPEMLAKYVDTLLRRGGAKASDDSDLEETLSRVMVTFKYIEDKDVFQKFYSRNLAKRLVNVTSASPDAEESMIAKLKETCGYEYTSKLQRMFQDIQISKDLNNSYSSWLDGNYSAADRKNFFNTHFQVLGTGFWPLNPPTTDFQPPPELASAAERFKSFYFSKHNGRKITWLWQLCKGELKATYLRNTKMPCTFQVSTYQMAILLLFNDHDSLDYANIELATKLSPEILDSNLAFLSRARVLNVSPEGSAPSREAVYSLNYTFKPKKVKINLNVTPKAEVKHESEETHKTVEEDRKLLLQSAIVRVMKSRKRMKHVQLVQEVINQVNKRFPPQISDIKKNIEALLEKEYIERVDNDEIAYVA